MAIDRPDVPPDRVRKAASKLTPLQREILLLSAGEKLPNEEIAMRLGISAEAVRGHLSGALCRLDRELDRLERPWWRFW